MTFDELKEEAKRQGYNLVKKPDWTCSCCCPYPNDSSEKRKRRCLEKYEFLRRSKNGNTYCRRKAEK